MAIWQDCRDICKDCRKELWDNLNNNLTYSSKNNVICANWHKLLFLKGHMINIKDRISWKFMQLLLNYLSLVD